MADHRSPLDGAGRHAARRTPPLPVLMIDSTDAPGGARTRRPHPSRGSRRGRLRTWSSDDWR
jgi:hypothetical protein